MWQFVIALSIEAVLIFISVALGAAIVKSKDETVFVVNEETAKALVKEMRKQALIGREVDE